MGVKAVMLNGVDVTDMPLTFGTKDQSITDLEVVLTNRVLELSGAVTDDRGQSVADCSVIVFATDGNLWDQVSRYVATDMPDGDGKFSVQGLPDGEYFAAAIDRTVHGEWQNPALLESVVRSATRVTLTEGRNTTVTLKLIARWPRAIPELRDCISSIP